MLQRRRARCCEVQKTPLRVLAAAAAAASAACITAYSSRSWQSPGVGGGSCCGRRPAAHSLHEGDGKASRLQAPTREPCMKGHSPCFMPIRSTHRTTLVRLTSLPARCGRAARGGARRSAAAAAGSARTVQALSAAISSTAPHPCSDASSASKLPASGCTGAALRCRTPVVARCFLGSGGPLNEDSDGVEVRQKPSDIDRRKRACQACGWDCALRGLRALHYVHTGSGCGSGAR